MITQVSPGYKLCSKILGTEIVSSGYQPFTIKMESAVECKSTERAARKANN